MAIQTVNSTTYKVPLLVDEVEIGDISSSNFKPHAKIKRWGDECFLKVSLATIAKTLPVVEDEKIKWKDTKQEVHFYPLAKTEVDGFTQNELGGFEFEVVLKEKPLTNKITLDIETQGLNFFYQPPLTQKEIDDGAVRPENVVGSYAFYHNTRTNMHSNQVDAEKYKCGKAFHLYRPKVKDSAGKEIWADLNIQNSTLTITIEQSFLDNAIYPVKIDPNFGYETVGGATTNCFGIKTSGATYSPASDSTGVSMSIHVRDAGKLLKMGLYDGTDFIDNGGTNEITAGATAAWITGNFSTAPSLFSATSYYLAFRPDEAVYPSYDTGPAIEAKREITTAYANPWPDPITWIGEAAYRQYSIYCTYTVGGETYQETVEFPLANLSENTDKVEVKETLEFPNAYLTETSHKVEVKESVEYPTALLTEYVYGAEYPETVEYSLSGLTENTQKIIALESVEYPVSALTESTDKVEVLEALEYPLSALTENTEVIILLEGVEYPVTLLAENTDIIEFLESLEYPASLLTENTDLVIANEALEYALALLLENADKVIVLEAIENLFSLLTENADNVELKETQEYLVSLINENVDKGEYVEATEYLLALLTENTDSLPGEFVEIVEYAVSLLNENTEKVILAEALEYLLSLSTENTVRKIVSEVAEYLVALLSENTEALEYSESPEYSLALSTEFATAFSLTESLEYQFALLGEATNKVVVLDEISVTLLLLTENLDSLVTRLVSAKTFSPTAHRRTFKPDKHDSDFEVER